MSTKKGIAKPRWKPDWWAVKGRAYRKRDGTLVLELKHPKSEYEKKATGKGSE